MLIGKRLKHHRVSYVKPSIYKVSNLDVGVFIVSNRHEYWLVSKFLPRSRRACCCQWLRQCLQFQRGIEYQANHSVAGLRHCP